MLGFDLHGILGGPFPCGGIVSDLVGFQKLRNIRHKRIIWIGVGEERTDTQKNLGNGKCRTPLVFENVQANTAVRVNVAVIDARRKMNFGGLWQI